ncbi:SPOR domain-containing protein [Desulfohalobiaceae bacterium Ax17]|uniref:SPOR domain-containing protein n=1 Tax=Desulfovulcanus ferrireducens TaxID=2831190 RepID=UPI00207BB56A|nr:SPOR domain-containing protein [Desulfovulcanus ferrireducens]MBT8763844.1 SPOR domain-containing protein [Desulfovulcanus ferrireducens]
MAKKSKKKTAKNKFKLDITLSGLIYLGIFIILAMVWAFILGVYIGRGYNPEDVVPEIAKILPETKSESRQNVPKQGTLRPEQLEFYEKLKHLPEPELKKDTAIKSEVKRKSSAQSPKNINKSGTKQNFFSYTFQVAAFKTLKQAKKMQKNLVAQGFISSVTKAFAADQPWFRVFVHFQGTPEQVVQFKNKLKKIGIKQPILKRKKPS